MNSIFWENNSTSGKDIYNYSENDIIVSYCDIDTTEINTPWTGENNINADPEFIDDSCHIAYTSQCIETGITSYEYNDETYNCPDFDIDGQIRPLNATADIGVDEVLITGIIPILDKIESPASLDVYPNPFKIQTSIDFNLKQSGLVKLLIIDCTGKEIRTLVSKNMLSGTHQFKWSATGLPTGIYFLRLETNGISETRKLLLLR